LFIYRTPPPLFSTLSLHDALPISRTDLLRPVRDDLSAHGRRAPEHRSDGDAGAADGHGAPAGDVPELGGRFGAAGDRRVEVLLRDRKSTRLNSSHVSISYAVFCLK